MFQPIVDRIEYGGALIGTAEVKAVLDVMLSQGGRRWTVGPESIAFEKELAEKTGVKYATVVNSGSSALLVALTALHLPKRSVVAIPAVNFPTAFNAILQCGLIPFVVDVDPKTLNISIDEVEKMKIKPDAVIAVNVASNPVDVPRLRKAVGKGCTIILDNCDGYGTTMNGKFVETQADMACVSFHAAHIITTGEGGAVLTDNPTFAARCSKLREWGRASGTDAIYSYPGLPKDYRSRYVYEEIGFNMKPLELQCAMGRVQLTRLEEFKAKRLRNYQYLTHILSKYPDKFELIETPKNASVCWFSLPFFCRGIDRRTVMDTLEKNNIESRTIFSGNVLRHPAYKGIEYYSNTDKFPNADDVMTHGMFLSVHPSITTEMMNFIDEVLGSL